MVMIWAYCNEHKIEYIMGDECPKCNEVVGKYHDQNVTFWELRLHPEILKDPKYINLAELKSRTEIITHLDWECKYCGCFRPSKEYKCDICGAPRKSNSNDDVT